MVTETVIEDPRWAEAGLAAIAERAVGAALAHLGLGAETWEVVVLGCDDARIAALNAQFRGKAVPTNVLSWPAAERGAARAGERPSPPDPADPEIGDIALAFETCAREAQASAIPFERHVAHLVVHGLLHCLGYDHETDADATLMESEEAEILGNLGLPDPYTALRPDLPRSG
ncbi:rRNA maturation RNase YbeY [Rhodosalinus sp. 5P4]|uniref:rRNA maturation RNase YbeY n=1 Tax=Rhodosalinus sp. 5P4 TaxID=3239196 RepID=UPI003523A95D